MTAEEYLGQIRKLVKLIRNKKAERELWQDITARSPQGFSVKVQTSPNPSAGADAILSRLDAQAALEKTIGELEAKLMEITATIEMLSEVHYDVLHMIYIQGLSLDQVAQRYEKSRRWVTYKRTGALACLQRILDEREKRSA